MLYNTFINTFTHFYLNSKQSIIQNQTNTYRIKTHQNGLTSILVRENKMVIDNPLLSDVEKRVHKQYQNAFHNGKEPHSQSLRKV